MQCLCCAAGGAGNKFRTQAAPDLQDPVMVRSNSCMDWELSGAQKELAIKDFDFSPVKVKNAISAIRSSAQAVGNGHCGGVARNGHQFQPLGTQASLAEGINQTRQTCGKLS